MARKSFCAALAALLTLTGTTACAQATEADPAVEKFVAWQEANQLPALMLETAGPAAQTSGGNRIGGAVWLPDGAEWPLDRSGKRMTFLAQIDFAELPPLPDYPTSGVLQFFIARDDLYGANFEQPEQGDFKVVWHETTEGEGRFETGPQSSQGKYDDYSPLYEEAALRGVALRAARAAPHRPSVDSWLIQRDAAMLPAGEDTGAWDAIYEYLESPAGQGGYGTSHIGGHPEFVQWDWRAYEPYQNVDRVLLNLWSNDDVMMWGDVGQGQFTIRREDLLKRDFSKVFYQWDCS
ncbi:YwqG family protein [Parerythrobacter lacustris]|uniref:YwqG family protein n=1 Tax=Parerythrobacter lacustris TaxID=2969984 RepID=A0ABT1XU69_9SPHN|nr:YwqG family protein [Parerythrobacter lacustris]MCR2835210.1 YwqG family protein [Parerythrobacter lacustris]